MVLVFMKHNFKVLNKIPTENRIFKKSMCYLTTKFRLFYDQVLVERKSSKLLIDQFMD